MKKRILAVLGTTVISLGTISAIAFASDISDDNIEPSQVEDNRGSCHSKTKKETAKMEKIMEDNGFTDMAKYMKQDDYRGMAKEMKTMSEDDYRKMTKIMEKNGYSHMSKMMKKMGKKGMIDMHNKMHGTHHRNERHTHMKDRF